MRVPCYPLDHDDDLHPIISCQLDDLCLKNVPVHLFSSMPEETPFMLGCSQRCRRIVRSCSKLGSWSGHIGHLVRQVAGRRWLRDLGSGLGWRWPWRGQRLGLRRRVRSTGGWIEVGKERLGDHLVQLLVLGRRRWRQGPKRWWKRKSSFWLKKELVCWKSVWVRYCTEYYDSWWNETKRQESEL